MFDIECVALENFRSYRGQHSLTFPTRPGLYLLTGRNEAEPTLGANGAGKSSLLDALYWCLYGRTTRGLKANDVVNRHEAGCRVSVRLQGVAGPFTVDRSQSPNSLTLDGKSLTQDELQKHLRIGPEAFLHSVMLPQFGDSFFDLKPADKLALFSQIMELEYWLIRSEAAAELATELDAERLESINKASNYKGQLEVLNTDIAELAVKQQKFSETVMSTVSTLKVLLQQRSEDRKQTATDIEFAEKALLNIAGKLAKIKKGTKVCPTCHQTIAEEQVIKDERELLQNRTDWDFRLMTRKRDAVGQDAEIAHLQKQIHAEKNRPNVYADEIDAKRAKIKSLAKKQLTLASDIEYLEQEHTAVSYWVGGFKRVRLFVIEEVLRVLEIEVNNNMSSLGLTDWRIEFDVERENKSGGVTKGFTVFIYPPGGKEPVRFEAWSGGETQRLRLAGDLGLANLIMTRAGLKGGIEFYDEPTSHLSEEGIADLLETLRQRAVDHDKKIWVVEHHSLDYGEFNGVLTAVKTGAGSTLVPAWRNPILTQA